MICLLVTRSRLASNSFLDTYSAYIHTIQSAPFTGNMDYATHPPPNALPLSSSLPIWNHGWRCYSQSFLSSRIQRGLDPHTQSPSNPAGEMIIPTPLTPFYGNSGAMKSQPRYRAPVHRREEQKKNSLSWGELLFPSPWSPDGWFIFFSFFLCA